MCNWTKKKTLPSDQTAHPLPAQNLHLISNNQIIICCVNRRALRSTPEHVTCNNSTFINIHKTEGKKSIFTKQIFNSDIQPLKSHPYEPTQTSMCTCTHEREKTRRRRKARVEKKDVREVLCDPSGRTRSGYAWITAGSALPPHPASTPRTSPLGSGISPGTPARHNPDVHDKPVLSPFSLFMSIISQREERSVWAGWRKHKCMSWVCCALWEELLLGKRPCYNVLVGEQVCGTVDENCFHLILYNVNYKLM